MDSSEDGSVEVGFFVGEPAAAAFLLRFIIQWGEWRSQIIAIALIGSLMSNPT
jgi:hypothetical protein